MFYVLGFGFWVLGFGLAIRFSIFVLAIRMGGSNCELE